MVTIELELTCVPAFNLALQQNALPLVSEVKLKNSSETVLENLECVVTSVPEFIVEKHIRIERLKAGEELALHDLGLELNYTWLAQITETTRGLLRAEIRGETAEGSTAVPVEAYSPDQWLGMAIFPELICSFVTPNLDAVAQLQTAVAEELRKATGSANIEGYQADSKRVYETCAAIYRVLHNCGINYSNPASSFGEPGQRIRFADAVLKTHQGTCLDLAVLFASIMERCCLHPVIVFHKGHAYVACHLLDKYFPDMPVEDLQMIRKLVDADELVVFETTQVTGNATFAEAEAYARSHHLNIDDQFQFAIDVVRARMSKIRPLPIKHSTDGMEFEPQTATPEELKREKARELQGEIDLAELSPGARQAGRVVRWTQKLLDLSLRNPLLNVRDNKRVIPIACSDIGVLEDKIAANEVLTLCPLGELLGEKDMHDMAMLRNLQVTTELRGMLDKELTQKRLRSPLTAQELTRRLTELYRQGKTDLESGGVNTLFLAIGFLEWKMTEREEKTHLAPILMIPVKLTRHSIADGVQIERLNEETTLNETLLELLRSQFHVTVPGLDPLPTDDSGVDVPLIMQIFRQVLKNMKGWELREEARLGHFSFGKFIMWNDMTARLDALKQNTLVNHLIESQGLYDDGIEVFPVEDIGTHLDLSKIYCPVNADSSQLAAVLYSEMGKSFVLHGPPGTGKSQTITNIIAHNLACGRRVLFVSEKKAALDVVHKRLSKIGLRPFCLELHSNKTGKTEVLAQFSEALNVAEAKTPEEWQTTITAMQRTREELNGYVRALHQVYPNGFSAYDCFSRTLIAKNKTVTGLGQLQLLTQSRDDFETGKQAISDWVNARSIVSPEALNAYACLAVRDWSPAWEMQFKAATQVMQGKAEILAATAADYCSWLGLKETGYLPTLARLAAFTAQLKQAGDIPAVLLSYDYAEEQAFLKTYRDERSHLDELAEKLKRYRVETFADMDFAGIASRIDEIQKKFFLSRFFKERSLLKEMQPLKKQGSGSFTMSELSGLLPKAEEYLAVKRDVDRDATRAQNLLGDWWKDGQPDWTTLTNKFDAVSAIMQAAQALTEDEEERKSILAVLQASLPTGSKTFTGNTAEANRCDAFTTAFAEWNVQLETYRADAPGVAEESMLPGIQTILSGMLTYADELRSAMNCLRFRAQVTAKGLADFGDHLPPTDLSAQEAGTMFEQSYCVEMLNQIIGCTPVLGSFSGQTHEERIHKFCELDDQYISLSQKIVFAKLAASLPRRRQGPCPEGTELGILKRECEKRTRQKPVRQLLEQIPTLAPTLKPCFLMSPLSVAQYLPPDTAPFDMIVFDEASQIPVWDAIGVIARGKQLIVVGDPKQMPPTNFFQKGNSEDDAEDDAPEETEDMESILDECLAAGVYSSYLNWHYRSRHEALIAFSNHYYYEDRLFTFPAARTSDRLGVYYEFVPDGVYDRKKSRTNRKEAEALVAYIFKQLLGPGKKRSMGVVTFSQAQKDLIEDMMEREAGKYPELASYFSEQCEEPFFVKNLENVQGDERDVILFSICYAPDNEGKFSMNFGPLNRDGGERRLNVAITRAKEQVVVFSSIHGYQVDLNRTAAVGASHLRYFLDYAEKGLTISARKSTDDASEGVTATVAAFLTEHGYTVERHVGCSGYRIDLAVRHPDKPEEYLLGIESDGPSYASQKTVRDRDHSRESVLSGLGWHMYRAWSVDWTFDRQRSEKALLELLEKLRKGEPEPPKPEAPKAAPQPPPVPVAAVPPPLPAAAYVSEHQKVFTPWKTTAVFPSQDFTSPQKTLVIMRQMTAVVNTEGPIYESTLKDRVMKAWGITRCTQAIQTVLNNSLPTAMQTTQYSDEKVYWPTGMNPADYRDFRVGNSDDTKRPVDEIPPEELANAMREIRQDFQGCEQDVLYRETMKIFGLGAVTARARGYLDAAYKLL